MTSYKSAVLGRVTLEMAQNGQDNISCALFWFLQFD